MSGLLPDDVIIADRRREMLDRSKTFCKYFVNEGQRIQSFRQPMGTTYTPSGLRYA